MGVKKVFSKMAGNFFLHCKKTYNAYYRMMGSLRKKVTYWYDDSFIKGQYKKL